MSIPLDRLYHYIESVANKIRCNDVLIYRFWPHGSKNINDLLITKIHSVSNSVYSPQLICYDQEPLNYDLYKDATVRLDRDLIFYGNPADLPKWNLRIGIGNIYDHCLLLHSERNSIEVAKYQQDQFVPVYYWSHALIARDWFRYAQHVNFTKSTKKTFLIYNRSWSGTREYRLKFTDLLIENNLLEHCNIKFNPYDNRQYYKNHVFINPSWIPSCNLEHYLEPTTATSGSSADFDQDDYISTDFEIVLETLFDDSRQHLTEKILRPIACKQPFILASTPGSLEYLRSYGFQTFDTIIDESYDLIQDPAERMKSIIKTMTEISSWTPEHKEIQMEKINKITAFNHEHFFSTQFFNIVTNELKNNLITAFEFIENNNIGQSFRDLRIKNIPGVRWHRKNHPTSKQKRLDALKKIKEYRKRNRARVK
jgi:hypothetical protein